MLARLARQAPCSLATRAASSITLVDGKLSVPAEPVIPFIEVRPLRRALCSRSPVDCRLRAPRRASLPAARRLQPPAAPSASDA